MTATCNQQFRHSAVTVYTQPTVSNETFIQSASKLQVQQFFVFTREVAATFKVPH